MGIHYLGGQLDRFLSPVRRLFAAVSDGQLEWTKCDPNYDICHNAHTGESIPFCGEPMEDMARIAAAPSFAAQEGVGAAVARFRRASLLAQLAGVLMVAHKACCAGEQVPSTLSEDSASCLPGPSEGLSRAYAPRSAASAA